MKRQLDPDYIGEVRCTTQKESVESRPAVPSDRVRVATRLTAEQERKWPNSVKKRRFGIDVEAVGVSVRSRADYASHLLAGGQHVPMASVKNVRGTCAYEGGNFI